MDEFTTAYIEAALWSSTDDDEKPLDEHFTSEDIAPETLAEMQADCQRFQEEHSERIAGQEQRAGHDFWLTRNGHGCGFWDGDWPEDDGAVMTEASKRFGEYNLYVGDDEILYGSKG